jgi:hypothetical protein
LEEVGEEGEGLEELGVEKGLLLVVEVGEEEGVGGQGQVQVQTSPMGWGWRWAGVESAVERLRELGVVLLEPGQSGLEEAPWALEEAPWTLEEASWALEEALSLVKDEQQEEEMKEEQEVPPPISAVDRKVQQEGEIATPEVAQKELEVDLAVGLVPLA